MRLETDSDSPPGRRSLSNNLLTGTIPPSIIQLAMLNSLYETVIHIVGIDQLSQVFGFQFSYGLHSAFECKADFVVGDSSDQLHIAHTIVIYLGFRCSALQVSSGTLVETNCFLVRSLKCNFALAKLRSTEL
jgi:hypothetical protein